MIKNIKGMKALLLALLLTTVMAHDCCAADKASQENASYTASQNCITAATNSIDYADAAVQPALDERVELLLANMTLQEKIGQLLMMGMIGQSVDDNTSHMLSQYHISGVVLFSDNGDSEAQVKKLTADLQQNVTNGIPLFIAIDEEGGRVVRMPEIITPPPAQLEVGKSGKADLATKLAIETAVRLKALGINTNFAPVADVGSLSTRHYSTNPQVVTSFVEAAAQGYEAEKEIFTLKHFPGIGKGKQDSHVGSVVVKADKATLLKEDVLPFQQIIKNHRPEDFFVMVSHIIYPQLAGNTPASLSSVIMSDLLRHELGYRGVIITDSLSMGAVTNYYGPAELGVRVIQAGADIALFCGSYDNTAAAFQGLLEAVHDGTISEDRIDESVRRVLRAKLTHLF